MRTGGKTSYCCVRAAVGSWVACEVLTCSGAAPWADVPPRTAFGAEEGREEGEEYTGFGGGLPCARGEGGWG